MMLDSQNIKRPNNNFIAEYKIFLKNHLLKLLGIVNKNLEKDVIENPEATSTVIQTNGQILFGVKGWYIFSLKCAQVIPEDNIRLARLILQRFFETAEHKRTGSGRNNTYYSGVQRDAIHGMAIQKGICDWIAWVPRDVTSPRVKERKARQVEILFNKLEKWAVKTYEGKKVTFGFIINPDISTDPDTTYGTWLEFLDDDYSAVLTDCIHTVIELDGECNFLKYHSISTGNNIPSCQLCNTSPLRFSHVIQKYVVDKKVGVFLLNNGDIILAKKQAVCFVKRNLQWLNLSYEAFRSSLDAYVCNSGMTANRENESLFTNIFASVLDVSFSHMGGIISVVGGESWENAINGNNVVLDSCDNLLNLEPDTSLMEKKLAEFEDLPLIEYKKKKRELVKRIQKRNIIKTITENKNFIELDRKLRSEFVALDGACILDPFGRVHSFGAIIQNDSGSSGGGRGAAAKKLSQYGFAVKISTDGYVELYVSGEKVYEIK